MKQRCLKGKGATRSEVSGQIILSGSVDAPKGAAGDVCNYGNFWAGHMAIKKEASKYIPYQAAWRISQVLLCQKEASMTKPQCSEGFKEATKMVHQAHCGHRVYRRTRPSFVYKTCKTLAVDARRWGFSWRSCGEMHGLLGDERPQALCGIKFV